jgi:RNA polymerase sigma factor (TIGR02999 family)
MLLFVHRAVILPVMTPVTQILHALEQGDPQAASQLLPLVYDELRRLAAHKLAQEKPGQTLNPTALVHEAYLRLVGANEARAFANSKHFLVAAAEAMQRILVENARRKKRRKHGGGRQRLDFETVDPPDWHDDGELVLAVDEALQQLAEEEASVAEVVRLRWFAGLSIEQTAAALELSVRTVNRHWAYARAWLYQKLKADGDGEK